MTSPNTGKKQKNENMSDFSSRNFDTLTNLDSLIDNFFNAFSKGITLPKQKVVILPKLLPRVATIISKDRFKLFKLKKYNNKALKMVFF